LKLMYSPGTQNPSAMTEQKTKIQLIEDAEATGELAAVYDEWRQKSGRQRMPGILKCFSHRPDFLREVMKFSDTVHFSEGHLSRWQKEAIASWVSWLNRCPY
jgi:alkylhydroperoxidase family enzyme